MAKFPVVFLPGNVVQPSAGEESPIKQLSYVQLRALRNSIGGGDINARTPDPQARRFEFKNFLQEGLERFDQQIPLNDIVHLSEFFALVEGLIFGHLRLRIFDLRVFKFTVPNHLRYMGVLLNKRGQILGGTDPDTLFFSASNASQAAFVELQTANNQTRNTNVGVNARKLLRLFKQKLKTVWQPDHILWMNLLDRLFVLGEQLAQIDGEGLSEGWKQIGPVTLRVSVAAEEVNFRSLYLPVYEENYRSRALSALSGEVLPVAGGLQLIVDSLPAGRISLPSAEGVGIQELLSLGAGTIEAQDVPQKPIKINYAKIRSHIQGIFNESIAETPHVVNDIVNVSPFEYPDVIRLSAQHDGFLALEGLDANASESFSQRFLLRMGGKSVIQAPAFGGIVSSLVSDDRACYYVDCTTRGKAFYVDLFDGERVAELTALGYILWAVFDREAVVETENSVVINGVQVMEFTGFRFSISESTIPSWPAYEAKAATLQRLKGALESTDGLFKAAVLQWLEQGYHREIASQPSRPSPVTLGKREWYVDNY